MADEESAAELGRGRPDHPGEPPVDRPFETPHLRVGEAEDLLGVVLDDGRGDPAGGGVELGAGHARDPEGGGGLVEVVHGEQQALLEDGTGVREPGAQLLRSLTNAILDKDQVQAINFDRRSDQGKIIFAILLPIEKIQI